MQQDWIMGLLGGGLIGTAAAIFLLVNGRVMGASGIIGGLIDKSGWHAWQVRSRRLRYQPDVAARYCRNGRLYRGGWSDGCYL